MGKEAPYDLAMEVVPNPDSPSDDAHGCTTATFDPDDSKVHMIFDENYINDPTVPTITIARTIIHEIIHAAIFSEVKKMNNGVNPVNTEYASLLQEYRDRSMESSHPIMSKYYVGMIANTLRDVNQLLGQDQDKIDFLNSIEGFDWNEYYLFLAYAGLEDTPEYTEYRKTRSDNFLNKYEYDGQANSTKSPKCN